MSDRAEILDLERSFWRLMARGDHAGSARLIAPQAAVIGPMGTRAITPEAYVKMSESSPCRITEWEISEETVLFPTPDTAVCLYQARRSFEREGKTETMVTNDSSVWARAQGAWKCVLHAEMPATSD